jgi:hypothetical protein
MDMSLTRNRVIKNSTMGIYGLKLENQVINNNDIRGLFSLTRK